jgi:hypothetical protein
MGVWLRERQHMVLGGEVLVGNLLLTVYFDVCGHAPGAVYLASHRLDGLCLDGNTLMYFTHFTMRTNLWKLFATEHAPSFRHPNYLVDNM